MLMCVAAGCDTGPKSSLGQKHLSFNSYKVFITALCVITVSHTHYDQQPPVSDRSEA